MQSEKAPNQDIRRTDDTGQSSQPEGIAVAAIRTFISVKDAANYARPPDPLVFHGQRDKAAAVSAVSVEFENVRTVTPALKKEAKEQKSCFGQPCITARPTLDLGMVLTAA